jgi:hypothetical protein
MDTKSIIIIYIIGYNSLFIVNDTTTIKRNNEFEINLKEEMNIFN